MKKFRKLFAVLTASALVGAMSFTTMAASITIKHDNTYDGQAKQKYKAYKILDVIKDDATKGNTTDATVGKPSSASGIAYSIASDSKWLPVLQDEKQLWLDCKPSADGTRYVVTLKKGVESNEATAKAMAAFFNEKCPENADVIELTADTAKTVVGDGYYLITSTLGTNLILATSDIEITEKNDYPKDDKKVETASITAGQNATYYITVVVPESIDISKKITVHDKLPNELSFNDKSVQVYAADTTDQLNASTPVTTLKGLNYGELAEGTTVITGLDDGCAFHIEIDPKNHKEKYVGQTLVFKYTATLKDEAAADTRFVNKEFLTYSEYKTTEKDVPVMTYDFGLTKTFEGSGEKDSNLTATFKLYDANNYTELKAGRTANAMKFKTDGTHYHVSTKSDATENITAVDDTELNVRGLGAGTYYLVETATANGYNVLDHEITITVTATYDETTGHVNGGRVSIKNGTAESNDSVSVENVKGLLLPSTGGMGTVAFAVVGLIVMAGAAVTLIIKKRA
ncbi:isopeptide-forming domain-containing fimbrial protein [Oribacterium sp. HCP3S3_B9]|uniref:isopeptide-forming domain-containing fimbrial protein n=1 Tax=Oribacterium sp. HCP3S3_B9 TaxID=3438946 RepID=UPI003F8ADDFE